MKKVLIISNENTLKLDGTTKKSIQLSEAECELEQLVVVVNQEETIREYPTDKYFYMVIDTDEEYVQPIEVPFN